MAITIIGLVQLIRGKESSSLTEPWFKGSSTSPSQYSLALYSSLWAFDGWDQANYVGGEIKNAHRNIPRAIHSSMAVVTVSILTFQLSLPLLILCQLLFLLANLSYFVVLDQVDYSHLRVPPSDCEIEYGSHQ